MAIFYNLLIFVLWDSLAWNLSSSCSSLCSAERRGESPHFAFVCVCACVYVGQRLMSAVSLKYFLPLFFFETVSHWTQSPHEFGQTSWSVSPNNPPIANTPVLGLCALPPLAFPQGLGIQIQVFDFAQQAFNSSAVSPTYQSFTLKIIFFSGWLTYSQFLYLCLCIV